MEEDAIREPGFYWVLPVYCPDTMEPERGTWPNTEQPAYWTGSRWAMLDTEDWEVCWVGSKIEVPA